MSNSDYGFADDVVFCVMLENHLVMVFRDWKDANEYANDKTIEDMQNGHNSEYVVIAEPLY